MSKYTPIKRYLAGIPKETKEITLSFNQFEKIIKNKLPISAFRYQEWWSNEESGTHVQAHAWMGAGWMVDTVNLREKWVRLHRAK